MNNKSSFFASLGQRFFYNYKVYADFLEWEKRYDLSYKFQNVGKDQIIALILILLMCFYFIDPLLAHAVRSLPSESYRFFGFITQFGSSKWYITPSALVVLGLWFMNWRKLSRRAYCQFLLIAVWANTFLFASAAGGLAANITKRMIGRARPRHLEDLGAHYFDPFAFKSAFASFPSGHSATIGSIAFLLAIFFPRAKWTILVFALMVGISRIIVGAHYPADVIAGLLFGAFFSWITVIFFAKRGVGFKKDEKALFNITPKWPKKWLSFTEFKDGLKAGFS